MEAGAESRHADQIAVGEPGTLVPFGRGDQHGGRRSISVFPDVGVEARGGHADRPRYSVDQVLIGLMQHETAD